MTSGVSQTQAQAEVMAKTAANFEDANQSLQQMLTGLMRELEVLQSAWRGAGGRSFEQVKEAWSQDQIALSRALAETATAIRTSGVKYSASDAEAASRVAATNRGMTLPL